MAKRDEDQIARGRKAPPASTPQVRENQLVNLAMDLAEKQLREGTATSQVISHFLKAGSEREKLEREKLRSENKLANARVEQIESAQRMEELYGKAIQAMMLYSGDDIGQLGDVMDLEDDA